METNQTIHASSIIQPSPTLLTGLAMTGGVSIVLIVLALALGAADVLESSWVSTGVLMGLLVLVVAVGGWVITVQPYRHFDDINIPADSEPHHEDHANVELESSELAHNAHA